MMKGYSFIIEKGFCMEMTLLALIAIAVIAIFSKKKRRAESISKRNGKPQKEGRLRVVSQQNEAADMYEEWKNSGSDRKASVPQYRDKFRLMNKTEHVLYRRLVEAAPALIVFSQVSMSQVFHINGRTKGGYRQLGEVGRKSIDFLLCRPDDTSIILAIELNGPTHDTERQKASDEKKQSALEQAGIPLIILTPDEIPDVASLRKAIAPHIVERKRYEAERNERIQSTPRR